MPEVEHRGGEPVIVTPVSAILTQIQTEQSAGFARLETSLAGKADKGDIIRLQTTVTEHGDRLLSLEKDRSLENAYDDRTFSRRQAFWAIALGVGIILSSVVAAVIPVLR